MAEVPLHVGALEFAWAVDTSVDVAFGSEVDLGARALFCQHAADKCAVTDIAAHGRASRVSVDRARVVRAADAGRRVQIADRLITLGQPVGHEGAAVEAAATSDRDRHGQRHPKRLRGGNAFRSVYSARACTCTSKNAHMPRSCKEMGAEAPFSQALRAALD